MNKVESIVATYRVLQDADDAVVLLHNADIGIADISLAAKDAQSAEQVLTVHGPSELVARAKQVIEGTNHIAYTCHGENVYA